MRPDIGATGTGVFLDTQHGTDGVILKSRREHIGGAVTESVGNQDARTEVDLSQIVGGSLRSDRKTRRENGAGLHGLLHGLDPISETEVGQPRGWITKGAAQLEIHRRVNELCRFRFDPPRSQHLKEAFRRVDEAAAIPTHIDDQAIRRELRNQAEKLIHELSGHR
jgi:hypothetical protein